MYELGGAIGVLVTFSLISYKLGKISGCRNGQDELSEAVQQVFDERKVRMEGIDTKGRSVEYSLAYLLNEAGKKADS